MSTRSTPFPSLPLPAVPWQITGNHWLAIPCIHPADGAIHAIGVVHRGARAAVELAGDAGFVGGLGPALARPTIVADGQRIELAQHGIAWERALNWLPTFTCSAKSLVIRGTIFAPYGRDADMAGAVYAIALENRASQSVAVTLSLEGTLAHRQLRVRTTRPSDDAHRVSRTPDGIVLLEGAALPGLVAVALAADTDVPVEIDEASGTYALRREVRVPAGGRSQVAFYLAAGPERDSAHATVGAMRRRGWRDLLTATRDALQALEQATGNEELDRFINRNLLFAYFYAVGRALDDAHYYMVRTRVPWNGRGMTARDWDVLAWILPAVQLADHGLAREILIRACELHGYAPGQGVHYLDGTLFEPGFSLEGAAAYALAVDRYIRDTEDDQIVEEPVVADTLYLASEDLAARRDRNVPLYSTEVTPSGGPTAHPYTLHGNAVAALALDVFRRTLDEDTARDVEDPDAVRAAIRRHFVLGRAEKTTFAAAVDLAGSSSADDDATGSALWLPLYEAVERSDSTYRRTVKGESATPRLLAQYCARLIGPDAAATLQWLRRAPLDNGLAAEEVDENGRALGNGGDAALSGLLAWAAWYSVHGLGTTP
ncbi:MAG TPA: hypothetical protein VHM67_11275 [Gemmatimonadaceae bacterium]|nr:hypothetical protein [Gemmatimonadaceae bacterium]